MDQSKGDPPPRRRREEVTSCFAITLHLEELGESQPPSKGFPLPARHDRESHRQCRRAMIHRDSPAPPLGHTMATITNRGIQSTMQGNKTSGAIEGHRNPRPHRRHEPPRDRLTLRTRMTKASFATTDHFHRHHRTTRPPNNRFNPDIRQPTADL